MAVETYGEVSISEKIIMNGFNDSKAAISIWKIRSILDP